jgi:HlyD family secretion protein
MNMVDIPIVKKRWTLKRGAFIAGTGAAAVFVVSILLVAGRGSRLNVKAERLHVSTVTVGDFQEYVPFTGTVIPISTHYLDAIEGGRVDTVYLEAGTFVKKGDRILELVNTNLLMDVMYREAEIFQQSNNLRNTRLSMEQQRLEMQRQLLDLEHAIRQQRRVVESNTSLAEKSLISSREFEESKDELDYLTRKLRLTRETQRQDSTFRVNQIKQLEVSLARMETNLEIVKRNMENLVIKAPVSGHLTSLNAETGESKMRGERLGQIDILDGFKVRVPIDEYYISRITTGLEGTFTLSGRGYSVAITKIYPEVVDSRFEVDMSFEGEEPEGIRRGQTLRIKLALGELSETVLLENGGFYQSTGGRWVYVLDGSERTASKREVHLGRQNMEYFEVLDGLDPGERVIVSSYETFGGVDQLVLK